MDEEKDGSTVTTVNSIHTIADMLFHINTIIIHLFVVMSLKFYKIGIVTLSSRFLSISSLSVFFLLSMHASGACSWAMSRRCVLSPQLPWPLSLLTAPFCLRCTASDIAPVPPPEAQIQRCAERRAARNSSCVRSAERQGVRRGRPVATCVVRRQPATPTNATFYIDREHHQPRRALPRRLMRIPVLRAPKY